MACEVKIKIEISTHETSPARTPIDMPFAVSIPGQEVLDEDWHACLGQHGREVGGGHGGNRFSTARRTMVLTTSSGQVSSNSQRY